MGFFYLSEYFEAFVEDRIYLKNVTESTVRFYKASWAICSTCLPQEVEKLSQESLNKLMVALRKRKQSTKSINTYLTFLNAFLRFIHEKGGTKTLLKIKKLREEQKVFKVFTEENIKRIFGFRPRGFYEYRLHAFLCLLLDTGLRLDEAINLRTDEVDFEKMYLLVKGKGRKERLVPFSQSLRKVLWVYGKKREVGELFFTTKQGLALSPRNVLRDMKRLCDRLSITGARISPHTLRHSYSIHYLANGGDLFTLSRTLGHSSISVTQIYLRNMGIEQIKEAHNKFSPLSKLR